MCDLPEEDKKRIREEMEYRESINQTLSSRRGRFAKFWAACAHPVIITILGGVILTIAGGCFQLASWKIQDRISYKKQLLDKKYALLTSLAEQFNHDLNIVYGINSNRIWLITHKKSDLDSNKRTYKDRKALYSKYINEYINSHKTDTMFLQISAIYDSEKVTRYAKALHDDMRKLEEEETVNTKCELDVIRIRIQDNIQLLAQEMGKEIKNDLFQLK